MHAADLATTLDALLDARVTGIRRVYYEIGGELDRTEGPLELTTTRGVVVLDADEDDDALATTEGTWQNPHGDAVDPDFVAAAGRWVAVDATDEDWARGLVGSRLTAYELGGDVFGVLWARLRCGDHAVRAQVEDGELLVRREQPDEADPIRPAPARP